MNIRYYCKSVQVDAKTKSYIEKRLKPIEKLLKNIHNLGEEKDVLQFEIEIDRDRKGKFRVEIIIKTPYETYRSEEISESIEGSVDILSEDLKNQISKNKDKKRSLVKKGARLVKMMMMLGKSK